MRPVAIPFSALMLFAAACDRQPEQQRPTPGEKVTVGLPDAVEQLPGATPMAERVAVLGFLNKRNGIVRDLVLRPGQAVRIRDAIVRLRACETTAPWETQKLTGAFIQLDVQRPDQRWQRVFSGWVYKESPSLNVVEHPVYDVWPKSCTMTYDSAPESPAAPEASSSRSSAPRSGGEAEDRTPSVEPARPSEDPAEAAAPATETPAPVAETPPPPPPRAADNNAM